MNSLKVSVLVLASFVFVVGCGAKKEGAMSLPPEQVLAGNAILAPQSVTLEAHNVALPVNAIPAQVVEPTSGLELTPAESSDKPTNKNIQQALKNAGLYNGPIDGNIGPKSKKAIREFQTQNGLTADGKVGARTWKKLSSHLQSAVTEVLDSAPISN